MGSNQAFSHQPGTAIECLSIPITLHKEENKCGFKIGGGIDQDYRKSPQGCENILFRYLFVYFGENREIPL